MKALTSKINSQFKISKKKRRKCDMDVTIVEEDPREKLTMYKEDVEEANIAETTTVKFLAIDMTADKEMTIHSTTPSDMLPSNTQSNPNLLDQTIKLIVRRKPEMIIDDVAEEVDKEDSLTHSNPKKSDPPPVKAYKLKISYPQRLRKEKMEELYAQFMDMIKEVRINLCHCSKQAPTETRCPESFLISCTLGNSITCDALADLNDILTVFETFCRHSKTYEDEECVSSRIRKNLIDNNFNKIEQKLTHEEVTNLRRMETAILASLDTGVQMKRIES
ncbi:hypothetical protein Tco_1007390 [Tanacetum coccineum]